MKKIVKEKRKNKEYSISLYESRENIFLFFGKLSALVKWQLKVTIKTFFLRFENEMRVRHKNISHPTQKKKE